MTFPNIPISVLSWCNEVAGADGLSLDEITLGHYLYLIDDQIDVLAGNQDAFPDATADELADWKVEQAALERIAADLRNFGVTPVSIIETVKTLRGE